MNEGSSIGDAIVRLTESVDVRELVVSNPAVFAIALGLLAVMAVDLFLGAPFWVWDGGRSVARGVRRSKAKKLSVALRAASGPRMAVLVATFRRDTKGALGALIHRALTAHLGGFLFDREVMIEHVPLDLKGPAGGEAVREWLRRYAADLMVWGEGGKGPLHRVFFLTAKAAAENEPVQEIRLAPPDEHADEDERDRLAAGIAYIFARTALPTALDADRYRVDKLLPVLDSLGALAHEPPSGLGAAFEQVLRKDAAAIALSVGRRRDDADELRRASRLRVRILAEIDRVTAPSDWALARADLGRVHLALGRLELDDKRLESAAQAFAEAVEGLTGEAHRVARAHAILNLAHTCAERAKLRDFGLRYAEAAKTYRRALKSAPDDDARFLDDARRGLAVSLHALAEIDGDQAALRQAIEAYRDARTDRLRAVDPAAWSLTSHRLGDALAMLAGKQGEPEIYEEALAAYREALKERARETHPAEWRDTWAQLGQALLGHGKTKPDLDSLNAAIDAFRNALKETSRDDDPGEWARLQNNVGNAHQAVGEATGQRRFMVSAVTAYRNAIEQLDKNDDPWRWAGIQNNLGNALHALGEKSQGVDALEAALTAHRNASTVRTREAARVDWAATRNNMGLVLTTLGARLRDPVRLEEAVGAFRDAVGVFRMAGEVRYAVMAERNLNRAKALLEESRRMAAE